MAVIILLFTILFIALAYWSLEKAVQLLLFLLPAYGIHFNIGPLPSNLLEVMVWVVFLFWFFKDSGLTQFLRGADRIQRFKNARLTKQPYPFGVELVLLVTVALVGVVVGGMTNQALGIWKAYFFEPALLYIVIFNLWGKGFNLPKMLWPLLASASALSLFAIYQKFTGDFIVNPLWAAEATRRVTSVFSYPNAVGLFLGPLVPLFIGWLAYAKFICRAPRKLILLIAMATTLSLIAIIFAKSVGALVGVAAAVFIIGLLATSKTRIATLLIVVVGLVGFAAMPVVRAKVIKKVTAHDLSGEIRRLQWRETLMMLNDGHYIFGAGLANYQRVIAPYHQEGFFVDDGQPNFVERVKSDAAFRAKVWQPVEIYLYPHNIVLNFWSELGLAGLLLFIRVFIKYFVISIQNLKSKIQNQENQYRYLVLGLAGSMVVTIIHGLVDVPYFKNDLAVMFWLFVAMLSMINNIASEDKLS